MAREYGPHTAHSVGDTMMVMTMRAIRMARDFRKTGFSVEAKITPGKLDDVVTEVDRNLQQMVAKWIGERLPGWGVLGEEESLQDTLGKTQVVIIDPLDGTKAFVRKKSHGTAFVMALWDNGEIIGVVGGDINTQEIYIYRPEHNHIYRITDYADREIMSIVNPVLEEVYIVLRKQVHQHSKLARRVIGRFKDCDVADGSIFLSMTRLWKGEVGAALLPPGRQMPWDLIPVIGMSEASGLKFYRLDNEEGIIQAFDPPKMLEPVEFEHETLIIHPDAEQQLKEFFSNKVTTV